MNGVDTNQKTVKVGQRTKSFLLLSFVLIFAILGGFLLFNSRAAAPVTYYVSKGGSNGDGKSWATAWSELNSINWSVVQPGDTIIVDGGSTTCPSNYDFSNHTTNRPGVTCGMLYSTQLNIQKSGSAGLPITIKLASETGRNGTAVVFGGRTSALPYCTQNYTASGTARSDGIVFNTRANGASYINIDGTKRSGIMVYGAEAGVDLISDNTSNVTLRNMEIFDNGTYSTFSSGGYHTDNPGIFLAGNNITLDKLLIHDNGQDEIQDTYTGANGSHAPMSNITLSSSWLYNHRDHPAWTGYPFNSGAESTAQDCTHVDGIQVWGGGTRQQNFTVKDSIFGPLLAQGFYPGDENNASFDNVSLSNTLFINSLLHNIEGDPINTPTNNTPLNWQISNITSYLTDGVNTGTTSHGFGLWGQNHSLTNSIFYNGYFANTASFTGSNSGNVYYRGDSVPGGTNTNPTFTGPLPATNSPKYADLVNLDFTPTCANCSGKGSAIHKVQDLLNAIDTSSQSTSPTYGNWAWDARNAYLSSKSSQAIPKWLKYGAVNPNVPTAQWAVATADASSSDPSYSIPLTQQGGSITARIPLGTQPDPAGDGHLTVRDKTAGTETDFWQAVYDTTTRKIKSASAAVTFPIDSVNEGTTGWGGDAANTPLRRGLITPEAISTGTINQTLQFTNRSIGGTTALFPGLHNANTCSNWYQTDAEAKALGLGYNSVADYMADCNANYLPEGSWLRIDPSFDIDAYNASLSTKLPAWQIAIAKGMQNYGMILRDNGGSLGVIGENLVNRGGNSAWVNVGMSSTGSSSFSANFPWNKMQLLCAPNTTSESSNCTKSSSNPSTCSTKQGDTNGDNAVNILDISSILSAYGQTSSTSCIDVNKDGSINILDISLVLSKYGT